MMEIDIVHHPAGSAEFDAFECKTKGKTLIVDFYAHWCKPCQMMAPIFEAMAIKNVDKGTVFVKVDVDECESVAEKYRVQSLPTFLAIRNGEVVDSLVGASRTKLPKFIEENTS